jgi:hypothetical protein
MVVEDEATGTVYSIGCYGSGTGRDGTGPRTRATYCTQAFPTPGERLEIAGHPASIVLISISLHYSIQHGQHDFCRRKAHS